MRAAPATMRHRRACGRASLRHREDDRDAVLQEPLPVHLPLQADVPADDLGVLADGRGDDRVAFPDRVTAPPLRHPRRCATSSNAPRGH